MAKKYFELAFELSGKTDKSLGSAFKGLKVDVDGLNKKIASLEKARGDTKRFEGLRKDIIKTNREYGEAQKKVRELAKEMKNTANPSQKLQNEFKKSQKEASSLKYKLVDQKNELNDLKGKMSEAGVSTKNFSKDQAALERNLSKTVSTQNRLAKVQEKSVQLDKKLDIAKSNTSEARGRLKDTIAMGATIMIPAKLAMDAEETMADINKVADFHNDEELKEMEKKIMEMNTKGKIPMTFNELGQIVASGAQAGIDKLELPRFASDAAKMGIAMDIEAEDAGQIMAGWRSAFDINQNEVIKLGDKINYLGNTTAASAPLISDFVTRVGAMGEVGGVQSGEIAALGATLIGMNIPAEVAATATNKLISILNKGGSATKKQQKVFKSLGLSATDMAKRMQTDSKSAIIDVMKAMDKLPEYEKSAALNELFGETGTKAVGPLLNNISQLEENLKKVDETQRNFAGSMDAEFETRINTSSNSLQILSNQMQNIGIVLGSILLPPIVEIGTKASELAMKVQDFSEKYPNLTKYIVMGTAAFLALNVAMRAGSYIKALSIENVLSLRRGLFDLIRNLGETTVVQNGLSAAQTAYSFISGKLKSTVIGQAIAQKGLSAAQVAQSIASKAAAAGQFLLNTAMMAFPVLVIAGLVLALVANIDSLSERFPRVAAFAEKAGQIIKNTFGKAIEWVSGKLSSLEKFLGKLGGKKGSKSSSGDLPGYAKGGIVTTPQIAWVGEGGASEAIIPLEKTANSMSLWEKTGRALGMDMSPKGIDIASNKVDGKDSTINNNDGDKNEFNFHIDARGAAPGAEELIKDKFLQEVIPIIMRLLAEKDKDKIRVSINSG